MFKHTAAPMLRRSSHLVLTAVAAAVFLVASSFSAAQGTNPAKFSSSFSSSMDGGGNSSNFGSEADSAAPVPAASAGGGGQTAYDHGARHGMFSRLAFEAGGGFNAPSRGSSSYITYGGNFSVGGGLRLERHITVLAEYQFLDDKLPGNLIGETGADGGYAHIWSLTLDPVIDIAPGRKNDLYITGGGGFYRKVTSFTDPVAVEYCNYYYCGIGTENQVVGHFSSNHGGWNAGLGITHALGSQMYGNTMKLFAEARYLYVDTPAVASSPNGLGTTTIAAETKLIPVTLGVRF